ncbi:type II toxin-antitoxin system RelE/ParE family toxin [Psychroflexus sp. CAK57W]|uniref:type II toxin-antitoxin system RelE/ParE family toxin n=1 Tax=Psychroflexus curvus TaxID=2873595 RepID=UPI001CCC4F4E|nr:type II toxin-antitoxin system RelE/ParE family toxin [Psychroflexus curvus]MBZ9787726.1 type II toxin-antitoxin system RelE/ParE family toxin [Psychroflexus curvus]
MDKAIIWTHRAQADLYQAFLDLLEQSKSIETTTRVISEIYTSVSILKINPEIYKLDRLKKNNRGNIRSYEKHRYRISYIIEEDEVHILRIRYARKEPLEY